MLSSIQISIPEELANRLKPMQEQIPHILELGLRRFNASAQYAFEGADDVLEFLAGLPEPEDIMKLHPSESFQARISSLLEKNRDTGLSLQEEREWEKYQYLEHLVRMAKAKACIRLKKTRQ
ncbi:Uncharacterized protein dnl_47590 [Desulfonema limicola]|uniref:Uncharacterized protein n=1 Tax=Desulfonema limicola TaxID=45656 RepID=A0A975BB46_9BACT|nr:hypothetical protein [Desulfonema limicola]QTA82384.1 Uncharacterized protein dnl_47590 [Desulfonema limicola]